MTTPIGPLLSSNLRRWISAKGFWLVAAATLLPLALTGAWVGTHRADVAVTSFAYDESKLLEGENVTFTAVIANVGKTDVGPFNSTIVVGPLLPGGRVSVLNHTDTRIEGLRAGESKEIQLSWRATPGVLFVVATADNRLAPAGQPNDDVSEIEDENNFVWELLTIRRAAPSAQSGPKPPANLTGSVDATIATDLALAAIEGPASPAPEENATYSVVVTNNGPDRVENATVHLRVASSFGSAFFSDEQTTRPVALDPGASETVTVTWTAREGSFWTEAWVVVGSESGDPDATNNHVARPLTVDPVVPDDIKQPTPPERATIKEFYQQDILLRLFVPIVIPLVALFYAAGVIADESERGTLAYLLTKPLPRWAIPITKFAASFLVAGVATVVGIALTYALLFGATSQGKDIGFLTTPLLVSLLALFAYGGLFTLIGVWSRRPYLTGLAFVLGWEFIVQNVLTGLQTAQRVRNLSIRTYIQNALDTWPMDAGVQWMPEDSRALWMLLIIGVGTLVGASVLMKKREFDI